MESVLLIGFGNPGRRDDGLGPAFAAEAAGWGLTGVTVETDYQLVVEDAAAVAAHDVVVFVDAASEGPEPGEFREVLPDNMASFTTHSVSPGAVLSMARELFGAETRGYLLAIRGYDFDAFGERLSEQASGNLAWALSFFRPVLARRDFASATAAGRG